MGRSNSSPAGLPVSTTQLLFYALPTTVVYFLYGPIVIIQGIYIKYYGLSLATVASILIIARVFDAITDPLVGYFSDRYYDRSGSRKLFVIVAGLLLTVSSYFLYVPVEYSALAAIESGETKVTISPQYFLFWFIAFYLFWTLFEIPHLAWGGQLGQTVEQKNKVYSLRAFGALLGGMLFFSVPQLPLFESAQFTPLTLFWSMIIAAALILPSLYWCAVKVPNKTGFSSQSPVQSPMKRTERKTLIELLVTMWANKPFLLFIGGLLFSGAGIGMWFGLMFVFVDMYLGLGHKLSLVYLVSTAGSVVALYVWYRLANVLGKKTTWALGMSVVVVGIFGSGALTQGESSWWLLLVFMLCVHAGSVAANVLAPSLMSDIVDYGRWKFGRDDGATLFSAYTLVAKLNLAIGGAAGLAIAGAYGFDPQADSQTESAVFGLRLSLAWLPGIITSVSILFIALIPINSRRYATIKKSLDRRDSRVARASDLKPPQLEAIL